MSQNSKVQRIQGSAPMLPGMPPVAFGGVQLRPMDMGRVPSNYSLWVPQYQESPQLSIYDLMAECVRAECAECGDRFNPGACKDCQSMREAN